MDSLTEVEQARHRARSKTALERYQSTSPTSRKMYYKARNFLAGGQSHNARHFEPYPFYASRGRGKYIWDVDGNRYIDYWMGHTALILGHSPTVVSIELRKQIENGLLLGTANKFALGLAELVSKCVPIAEQIRFCTSGAEATMYAIRLARAFTRRKHVAKIAGGWHGYNSSLTVGVSFPYETKESAGLIQEEERLVKLLNYNDIDSSLSTLNDGASDIAAVILEPVLGAGGVIPAERDYLKSLRETCDRIGALLIFDEIITGFRLALGGAQEFYNLKPDLCTLGKILGGGLPASAIAGRSDVLGLADTTTHRPKEERCWIGGGTFSEHALSMRAGIATLKYLRAHKSTIYPALVKMGSEIRSGVDKAFLEEGISTKSTGAGSLYATHFLKPNQREIRNPLEAEESEKKLAREYYFTLIANHGIFFLPGHIGAISTAHKKSDIDQYIRSTGIVASQLAKRKR